MGILHWLADNWINLLNLAGVAGLFFTAYSLHSETKTRRITNLLSLTESHRDIWKQIFSHPRLGRVLDPEVKLSVEPLTPDEEIFVNLVIQHVNAVFHTLHDGLTIKPEGLRRDVWWFFSLPIPLAVWQKVKALQNDKFVAFIEACRNWK